MSQNIVFIRLVISQPFLKIETSGFDQKNLYNYVQNISEHFTHFTLGDLEAHSNITELKKKFFTLVNNFGSIYRLFYTGIKFWDQSVHLW